MSFILSIECHGKATEYFQVASTESALDLKKRYCAKHSLALDKVAVYSGQTPMKDTDTLTMFATITMKVEEGMRPEAAVSVVSHGHGLTARLKPWSEGSGKPKGCLRIF